MAALPRIDRAAHLRKDTSRLMSALDAPETLLVPVYRDKNLFTPGGEDRAALLTVAQAASLVDSAAELVWLGLLDGKDCFALDLSNESEARLTPFGRLGDLRFDAGLIPAE